MKLVNLTRDPVTIKGMTIQPTASPILLNIVRRETSLLEIDGIANLYPRHQNVRLETIIHGPLDLPPRVKDVMYIVTMPIAQLVRRADFVTIDVEDSLYQVINDKKGI